MSFFEILTTQLSIKDFFDIFIVAVIIYQVLLIVQGTRAVQMLLGLGLLLILYWLGISYKLYSVNWMLDHFFDSFFVIFIILFQDSIRKALTQVGMKRRLFKGKNFYGDTDFEEIIHTCNALSRERVGALIVLERNNGLLNYTQTGTPIGAVLHSDLLYSIFQPRSPLHDGAVIIQQRSIVAAGCFLPLSKNIEIDKHMGTRHRAGLGISEISDAIVLIVSEETGKINIVHDGNFYNCEDDKSLRQYLKYLWTHEKIDERFELSAQGDE